MKKTICVTLSLVFIFSTLFSIAQNRVTTDLSGSGWKLWQDNDTIWKQDELFLPPVTIAKLPVHIPTGGWDVLNDNEEYKLDLISFINCCVR